MPGWDFPRGPVGARLLVRTGLAHGLTAGQCLAGTGLAPADVAEHGRLEAGQELGIARNLVRWLGNEPGLGVQAGRDYTLEAVGVWGFALLTSPTWGDAVEVGVRYFELTTAFVRPELVRANGELALVLHDDELPEDVRELLVERDLAAIAALVAALVDGLPEVRFETTLDDIRAAKLSELLPGAEFTGRGARHLIAGDHALLSTPLPQADEHTWRNCKRDCQALLDGRSARTGTAARVRSELLAHPARSVRMDQIAAGLHLDVRTLRRRLTAEGTSFRALKAEIHETMAIELLGTVGLGVGQVAQRLGYSDLTSFTHAFTRWTGRPPSSYRTGGQK
ncbi:AraC family transcriptional regulator [Amycolatopsis nigrescens]|uniref:AraC family transcriptional regulator n=1 Tax=Amycolatopsis nigrescens TaxID=381445 RepID=UPI0003621090|nr:AraC family transcriptional regulator [Amycolatopsis nigrescens]